MWIKIIIITLAFARAKAIAKARAEVIRLFLPYITKRFASAAFYDGLPRQVGLKLVTGYQKKASVEKQTTLRKATSVRSRMR
jgi:hypothetical protein